MAEVQVKRVSVKHDAILDYMLTNPAAKLGEVARHFCVSQPWLSVVIHSDVFQARLKEKNADLFHGTIVPLREQLMGVARVGVEKLGEVMENASPVTEKQFIADTTSQILANLGYNNKGPTAPAAAPTNVNVMVVDRDALAEAREKMRAVEHSPPAPALEHDTKEVPVGESPMPAAKEL